MPGEPAINGRDDVEGPARRPRAEAGFTLVEIMIVVFIIALMSTVVIVNLPAGKPAAATRVDALHRDLTRAAREAIVSGEPLALAVRDGRYRFERYRGGYWSPAGAVAGGAGSGAGAVTVEVFREGEDRLQARRDSSRTGQPDDSFERKLVFSPVGDATPVEIYVTDGVYRRGLAVSSNGEIRRIGPDGTEAS